MNRELLLQRDELKELIKGLKSGELTPTQFFNEVVRVMHQMDVDNEKLKGVIPFLVSALNVLIKNIKE
ncbi:MAG: hypothetical protein ABGW77_05485 [Campylobacterales bacterium]